MAGALSGCGGGPYLCCRTRLSLRRLRQWDWIWTFLRWTESHSVTRYAIPLELVAYACQARFMDKRAQAFSVQDVVQKTVGLRHT